MRGRALLTVLLGLTACERSASSSAPPPERVRVAAPPAVEHAKQEIDTWEAIEVESGGGTTELKKTPQGWRLARPVSARADGRAVHSLLRALGTPLELKDAAPAPAVLKAQGLAIPRFRVRATRPGETIELHGGNEDPFDGTVALQKTGSPALYSLPGGAAQALDATTYALRDRTVLPWRGDEVVRVEVKQRKQTFAIQRAKPSGWERVGGGKVDTSAVTRALSADAALRFQSFIGTLPLTRAADLSITWTQKSGEQVSLSAWTVANGQLLAVRRDGDEQSIGPLPERALDDWRSAPDGFEPPAP